MLTGFVAVTAIASGAVLMLNPKDAFSLQAAYLAHTPFQNYFIPGMILLFVVGGTNLLAFIINYKKHTTSFFWSLAAGLTISGWILVQIALLSAFSWLQILYLLIGLFILLMTLQLKHKELI
jgi:hypothetical protein